MDTITRAEEGGLVIIVGLVLALIAFGTYEFVENKTAIEEAVKNPIVETPIIGVGGVAVEEAVKEGEKYYEVIKAAIFEDKQAYYTMTEGEPAFAWLQLFGADVYNDGFASFHFDYLNDNAVALSKIYGRPIDYFNKYGYTGCVRQGSDGTWRLSPFEIRQNLNNLPFSEHLHGLFGSSSSSLKDSVWTDWDRLPEWAGEWKSLSSSKRNSINEMRLQDRSYLESLETTTSYKTWIVRDRVKSWQEIFLKYKLITSL